MIEIVTNEADWRSLIKKHDAIQANKNKFGPGEKAIWFETINFAWLLSAKDENGKRKILAQF